MASRLAPPPKKNIIMGSTYIGLTSRAGSLLSGLPGMLLGSLLGGSGNLLVEVALALRLRYRRCPVCPLTDQVAFSFPGV